jgi:DNA-binding NtrC family response regulator
VFDDRPTRPLFERQKELVIPTVRLEVVSGPDRGKSCVSAGQELVAGTAEGNQLVLTDGTVSRHHFSLRLSPRGLMLADLGSTNGTTVDGLQIAGCYLALPCTIGAGLTQIRVERTGAEVREPLSDDDDWADIVGTSAAMRRLFLVLAKLAPSDATVLLEGETGCGKTAIAAALHRKSKRSKQPFVVVDCGAVAPSLIESELFGHEKGAFTGATGARVGAFEAAHGGTIFLDEIGELPLDLQPKLLRVLDDHSVKRVGGEKAIAVNVRVVAATNRALHEEVNRGAFRSDLFYRLNVVRLRIPPLRERAEDVPVLVRHFHRQIAAGAEPPQALVERMAAHSWPGNVRELRAAIERAVLLGDADLADAPSPTPSKDVAFDESVPFKVAKERAVAAWERGWLQELIRRHDGNLSAAARAARTDRNYLRELLRRHKIAADD